MDLLLDDWKDVVKKELTRRWDNGEIHLDVHQFFVIFTFFEPKNCSLDSILMKIDGSGPNLLAFARNPKKTDVRAKSFEFEAKQLSQGRPRGSSEAKINYVYLFLFYFAVFFVCLKPEGWCKIFQNFQSRSKSVYALPKYHSIW